MNQTRTEYDVIVVGAGPGGLSAATYLSRQGLDVLVVEKNDRPGGNCTARQEGDYLFDLAVHQLTGITGKGQCGKAMQEYGVLDHVEFRQVDPFLVVGLPDRDYHLPGDWKGLHTTLIEAFPHQKKGIEGLLRRVYSIKQDSLIAQRLMYGRSNIVGDLFDEHTTWARRLAFPFTIGRVMLDLNTTGEELLARYISDPKCAFLLSASWPYLGLPPSELSGIMMAFLLAGQHMESTYYPVGSSQHLANTLANLIRDQGGSVLLNSAVRRIVIDDGQATGVELVDGRRFSADTVICNAPARHTYDTLLRGEPKAEPVRQALGELQPSVGPFKLYLGLDIDLAEHGMPQHEYLFYDSYDHDAAYQRLKQGHAGLVSAYSPTNTDRSLAPKGHSTLILTTMMPWKTERDWRQHKDALADEMLAFVERRVPHLRAHIRVKKVLTPADLSELTHTTDGAMYGWANKPGQVLVQRFAKKSPIEGLFHVGHWTQPGTGVTTSLLSGYMLGRDVAKATKGRAARVSGN